MRVPFLMRPLAVVAVLVLTLAGMLASSPSAAHSQETNDLDANKALAQRFHEDLFNQGNLDAADEILTSDFTWYSPPQTVFLVGPAAIKEQAAGLRETWPDVVITTDDVVAEGDRVVNRWTLRATATTESGTEFPIVYTGIDIFRIEDGKLAELWQNTDDLGLEQQFAAATSAGTPTAATPTS
jgi:predicted SnoaL-like aldol condensation-catalyzing enzyme